MIKIVETDVIAKKCLNVAVCKTCEVITSIRLNSKVKRCVQKKIIKINKNSDETNDIQKKKMRVSSVFLGRIALKYRLFEKFHIW